MVDESVIIESSAPWAVSIPVEASSHGVDSCSVGSGGDGLRLAACCSEVVEVANAVELGCLTFFFKIPAGLSGAKTDMVSGCFWDPPVTGGRMRFSGSFRVTFFLGVVRCFEPTVFQSPGSSTSITKVRRLIQVEVSVEILRNDGSFS